MGEKRPLQPIERLPLHIISEILARLDSIHQVGLAIRSHSIFRDAFKEGNDPVTRSIVTNVIPRNVLPFAVALLESAELNGADGPAAYDNLMIRLEAAVASNCASLSGRHYSVSDCIFLSDNYRAVEALRRGIIWEMLPAYISRLGFDHHPSESTEEENFRIRRALFRYQIFCNVFCPSSQEKQLFETPEVEPHAHFFSMFSPWVNEQIFCVYAYMERKIAEACEDVAARDTDYKWLVAEWCNTRSLGCFPSFLCRGLVFLSSVLCAETYEEKQHQLLSVSSYNDFYCYILPHDQLLRMRSEGYEQLAGLVEDAGEPGLIGYTMVQLDRLTTPLDGEQDSTSSSPCHVWVGAHGEETVSIYEATNFQETLWECGHVLWDSTDTGTTSLKTFREKCSDIRYRESFFLPARGP